MNDHSSTAPAQTTAAVPHIVIVGGGAGGLVLATRLAHQTHKHKLCKVTLVDESLTHVWKPLLHEIASGSLNSYEDELSYLAHAATHHYYFELGRVHGVDTANKRLLLDAFTDSDGREHIPARALSYDTLIMAIGSEVNDFGVPGVVEHAFRLDSRQQAERLHTHILGLYMAAQSRSLETPELDQGLAINIIGAGATGVELATELYSTLSHMTRYGLSRIRPETLRINVVEAAPSILGGQSDKVVREAQTALTKMGINVLLNTRITGIHGDHITTAEGEEIPTSITVWTTGVKAPAFLTQCEGLTLNRNNQIIADDHLRATGIEGVYAIGDCAAVTQDGRPLGPRAQVAQQQAVYLAKSLADGLRGKPQVPFVFRDKGSFISLGSNNSAATIMTSLMGNFNIHGISAKWAYLALYRQHQLELLGFYRASIQVIKDVLTRAVGPRLKLH